MSVLCLNALLLPGMCPLFKLRQSIEAFIYITELSVKNQDVKAGSQFFFLSRQAWIKHICNLVCVNLILFLAVTGSVCAGKMCLYVYARWYNVLQLLSVFVTDSSLFWQIYFCLSSSPYPTPECTTIQQSALATSLSWKLILITTK